jgi:branched-chain amino acid transport system ATP-binding protein
VDRGVIQVMEGRHCFEHLTVEENLLTGAYTRKDGKRGAPTDLEMVYSYFPRLKERRKSQAGYTSGGEQQMTAIGRALMSRPETILLDEPSMGLAPQLVEQIFDIVKRLNEEQGVLPAGEQNTNVALRFAHYGYILESGRVVMDGPRRTAGEPRREGILSRLDARHSGGHRGASRGDLQSFSDQAGSAQ